MQKGEGPFLSTKFQPCCGFHEDFLLVARYKINKS